MTYMLRVELPDRPGTLGALASALGGAPIAVSWTSSRKQQPANTRFPVPPVDAPNVNGARDLGLVAAGAAQPDAGALRAAVESGAVKAVYVLDPGPEHSIGDVHWLIDARRSGRLPLLVVQGVLMTPLAEAADFILPGAAYVEKDAVYTNGQGRVQAASQVLLPSGDATEDWQILVNVAAMKMLTGNHSVLSAELRRYSRCGLRDRLERAGFAVRRITYTNFSLLPFVLSVRLAQRIAGHHESETEMTVPSAPINAALSAVLAIEAQALKITNMPLGSSLLALACKRAARSPGVNGD